MILDNQLKLTLLQEETMIDIKLENFKTQVEQFENGKNNNAQALLKDFDYKLYFAEDIINAEIKEALGKIHHLYYTDSEEYRILNEDRETYNLKVSNIKKDDSEGKADYYLVSVESHRDRLISGKFHLSPHTSNPNGSNRKYSFTCSWDSLTYFCTSFATNGVTILPAFPARKKLYYYTSIQCALDNLRNEHIKVSRLGKVNDPYECMPIMHNENGAIMTPTEVFNFRNKVVHTMKGFVSFSRDWNIEPMWGLYADSYKGAVLEFDIDALKVQEVLYAKERFDCQYGGFAFDLPEILCRKSQNWSFERECRWIQELHARSCSFDDNNHFIPIDIYNTPNSPITLKRIICGPLMSQDDINRLRDIHLELSKNTSNKQKRLGVSIIQAEFRHDSYGLRISQIII